MLRSYAGRFRITRSFVDAQAASALEDGRHAHAARRANGYQAAFRLLFVQDLRESRHDPAAGRGKRMADRDTAALHVQFRPVDGAQCVGQSELVAAEGRISPGLESAQNLARKRLMDLVIIEVLKAEPRIGQHAWNCV